MAVIEEVTAAYEKARTDQTFLDKLDDLQTHYAGRPSPLYEASRLSAHAGGARIFLKREDLNHTGSHKINNVLGQALLARQMGKSRVIAETGAGQHGVATATACALLGLECVIYMGAVDTARQALNVARMRLLGAEVVAVQSGSKTLKDAVNEAFRDWVAHADDTYYCFGTAAGPHPFPLMVRDFQRVIGLETRAQILAQAGRLPDAITACVGGGSNAIGIFHAFIDDPDVRLIGYEAGGDGVETGRHAATFAGGSPGAFQGSYSYVMQDVDGQTIESHSISAGLDYPGVGPEHAFLKDLGRTEYRPITDYPSHGGVPAAVPAGRDHPGHRDRARDRRELSTWPRNWGRSRSSWSTCPVGETKTSRPRPAGSACSTVRDRGPHDSAAQPAGSARADLRRLPRAGPGSADRLPADRISRRRDLHRRDGRDERRLRHHRGRVFRTPTPEWTAR